MSACQLVALFAAVTVAVLIGSSDAVRCYECDSRNPNCFDPFKSTGIRTCTGAGCYKAKADGVIRRLCGQNAGYARCETDTYQGYKGTACVCYGDYCNSGPQLCFSSYLALISLFLAFLLFSYHHS